MVIHSTVTQLNYVLYTCITCAINFNLATYVLTDSNLATCTKLPHVLTDSDALKPVTECVADLNHKWFHLGISLGMRYHILKNIEASSHHNDVRNHMTNMLQEWLKHVGGPPSWRALALALESPLVKERPVARKVLREHQITFMHT